MPGNFRNSFWYPDKLQGDQILLRARILAVADCFDTMVSDRAYKPARSYEEAFCELRRRQSFQAGIPAGLSHGPRRARRCDYPPCGRTLWLERSGAIAFVWAKRLGS
jgi:hypothetical protein